ncbi:MAG: hypothetical protein H6722_15955 [Sandaracinus sp.]|nr:hypothetical protein [Sandaracinus sp.]
MRLTDLRYRDGKLQYRSRHATEPEWVLASYLEDATRIVHEAELEARRAPLDEELELGEDFEALRWFPTPSEIAAELRGDAPASASRAPVHVGAGI